MLQEKIKIKLKLNKVNSYIETRNYKEGVHPNGDAYSIRLNEHMDVWAGDTREEGDRLLGDSASPQLFYKESPVMFHIEKSTDDIREHI